MARTIERPPGPYDYVGFLGLKDHDWPDLIARIERGLPYSAIEHLRRNAGLDPDLLLQWIQIAPRTLARRKAEGRLSPEESDRLLRVARVFGCALDLFHGDRAGAVEWLSQELAALDGATPMEVSRTYVGAREVEEIIGRVRQGVYS